MADSVNSTPQKLTTSFWLLVTLFASLLVLPLLEGFSAGRPLLLIGLTSTFVVGAMATRLQLRFLALVLPVLALPTAWATLFFDATPLFVAHCLLGSVFFWLAGGAVMYVAIRKHMVTFDTVFGAICAYLLFGLAWALSYWAVFAISPQAFSFPVQRTMVGQDTGTRITEFSHFVYYSFVTMSTLGYGDITPSHRVTRTLSWVQSITGQFYVAVVIAWLVSALPRPRAAV